MAGNFENLFKPLRTIDGIPSDDVSRRRLFKRIDSELCRCNQSIKGGKDVDGLYAFRVAQIISWRDEFGRFRNAAPNPTDRAAVAVARAPPAPKPALDVVPLVIDGPFLALPPPGTE